MTDMIRRRIVFYGQVQGVGFRYIASREARDLGLTGWVRNEYDGSVTMEVQGPEAKIDMLLQFLMRDRYIDIMNMDVKKLPVYDKEKNFGILH